MRRPRLLTLLIVVLFVIGVGGINPYRAEAATTKLHVIILAQSDLFVATDYGCRVDPGNEDYAVFKIVNQDGRQTGGFGLTDGDVINATGPSGVSQVYCAFMSSVDVGATGVVRLEIDDNFLMTLDVDTLNLARHLVLEVDGQRLVAIDYANESEVRALGLEPLDLTQPDAPQPTPTETGTGITRTPRTGSAEGTPSPVAMPADASVALENSRDRLREGTPQADIVTGEWELEEPPMLNMLFVTIDKDIEGVGPFGLMLIDPDDLEEMSGFPVLSEDTAPEGCRAFTMQGPYGTTFYWGMCADTEYLMLALGTDQDVVAKVMRDFADGKPFTIPPGYEEAPRTWKPTARWVA